MAKIWKKEISLELLNERSKKSFSDHLGIVYSEIGDNYLTATMPASPYNLQPFGILHGGANCALAETVGSAAATFCIDYDKELAVGLEINVNHLRAVTSGSVEGIAKPLHLGEKTHVWEIRIFHEKRLSAIARLTLMILPRKGK